MTQNTVQNTKIENCWNASEAPKSDGLESLTYRSKLLG